MARIIIVCLVLVTLGMGGCKDNLAGPYGTPGNSLIGVWAWPLYTDTFHRVTYTFKNDFTMIRSDFDRTWRKDELRLTYSVKYTWSVENDLIHFEPVETIFVDTNGGYNQFADSEYWNVTVLGDTLRVKRSQVFLPKNESSKVLSGTWLREVAWMFGVAGEHVGRSKYEYTFFNSEHPHCRVSSMGSPYDFVYPRDFNYRY